MKLTELFKMQQELDERIVRDKGLQDQNLLPNKILSLQVELAELANEWQMFKFWKKNPQPRTKALRNPGMMMPEDQEWYNPLLEEYVDCLHFLLSIGLELSHDVTKYHYYAESPYENTISLLSSLISEAYTMRHPDSEHLTELAYVKFFCKFIDLGRRLGFSWRDVEEAYRLKNQINHHRQERGY
ncbi:dUTP diphosphatase [Geobacillus subterraneus]|uniref:dUTP diphosphatase n=1 Tax=Geobacillus subterraneus TaxID=129338 RepID=UPI001442BC97|nr:dUTP diphosphatase [Geobacillus subterraneus]QIZ66673.1 dUTPase [Geobacillus subterraneus]